MAPVLGRLVQSLALTQQTMFWAGHVICTFLRGRRPTFRLCLIPLFSGNLRRKGPRPNGPFVVSNVSRGRNFHETWLWVVLFSTSLQTLLNDGAGLRTFSKPENSIRSLRDTSRFSWRRQNCVEGLLRDLVFQKFWRRYWRLPSEVYGNRFLLQKGHSKTQDSQVTSLKSHIQSLSTTKFQGMSLLLDSQQQIDIICLMAD